MWNLEMGALKEGDAFADAIHAVADKVESEHGITVRNMNKRDLEAEIGRFMEVYNSAWEKNWGFVPITDEEVAFQAKNLKQILDPRWAFMAERDGEILGAALSLPDINQVTQEDERAPAARSAGCASCSASGISTAFASSPSASSRSTSTPGLRRASMSATSRPLPRWGSRGRGGLDPRGQRADEPRHGGNGRHDRQALPAVREESLAPAQSGNPKAKPSYCRLTRD